MLGQRRELSSACRRQDALIAADRRQYELRGGCTALAALFLLGRLYLANAGDSRALLCRRGRAMVASHDFTPETERQRLRQLVSGPARNPQLYPHQLKSATYCVLAVIHSRL